MDRPSHILLVEDDTDLADTLAELLEDAHFRVCTAGTAELGLAAIEDTSPDLMVLDLTLPDMDGMDVLKTVRQAHRFPVLLLTGRDSELQRVLGLELGADDFLAKPFSMLEMLARVKALLRRAGWSPPESDPAPETSISADLEPECGPESATLFADDWLFDCDRACIHRDETRIDLVGTEVAMLACLTRRPGIIRTRDELLRATGREERDVSDRSIDVALTRLRQKAAKAGCTLPVEAVRGMGYRWNG